jgi:hypothetical protein
MEFTDHHGYAKPILRLVEDSVVVENVPVPKLSARLQREAKSVSERLSSVQFLKRAIGRFSPSRKPRDRMPDWLLRLTTRVVAEVQRIGEENGAATVFVYLPTQPEAIEEYRWRAPLTAAMDSLGYAFVDLTPDMRRLPAGVVAGFFIPESQGGAGHYTAAGNAWVANALHERMLLALPSVRPLLATATDSI